MNVSSSSLPSNLSLESQLQTLLSPCGQPAAISAISNLFLSHRTFRTDAELQVKLWLLLVRTIFPTFNLSLTLKRRLFDYIYQDRELLDGPAIVWRPSPASIPKTNIYSLMTQIGIDSYPRLHRWSVDHLSAFWKITLARLGILFYTKPQAILGCLNLSLPCPIDVEFPQWFAGSRLNIMESCFLAQSSATALTFPLSPAPMDVRLGKITYGQLLEWTNRVANGLMENGFKFGDAIAIDMPMIVESIFIYLGIVKAGMIAVCIAESFPTPEIERRLRISNAKAIFTVDRFYRDEKKIQLYPKVLASSPQRIILVRYASLLSLNSELIPLSQLDPDIKMRPCDLEWTSFLSLKKTFQSCPMTSDSTLSVLFSSGTTGDPKAIPWSHSTAIKAASDGYYHQDLHPGDVICWPTSLGWMMGLWLIFQLINRVTIALYDDVPRGDRYFQFINRAKVTMLGIVPTMVKSWIHDDECGKVREKYVRVQEDNGRVRGENRRVRGDNGGLQEENGMARRENRRVWGDNGGLQEENRIVRGDNGGLQEENRRVRGDNGGFQENNRIVRGDNGGLQEDNRIVQEENGMAWGENRIVRGDNGGLQEDNIIVQEENVKKANSNQISNQTSTETKLNPIHDQWGKHIRCFSSTAECSHPNDIFYVMNKTGFKAPVIEYSGGTEIGGAFITSTLLQDHALSAFTTPALGSDFVVLKPQSKSQSQLGLTQVGEHGEIFLLAPSVGLSEHLLNRDHHQVYYQGIEHWDSSIWQPHLPIRKLRRHGDEILVLARGFYQAMGRTDDSMKLAGIKVSSAEIERIILKHDGILEAAAVSHQSTLTGLTSLVLFIILKKGQKSVQESKPKLGRELQNLIKEQLNPLFKISDIVIVTSIPKTASNKTMRRILRDIYVKQSKELENSNKRDREKQSTSKLKDQVKEEFEAFKKRVIGLYMLIKYKTKYLELKKEKLNFKTDSY